MFPIMTNILQSSESPRVNLRALPASNSVLTWLVLAPRDTPNAERRPGARDSHMTHRWRKPDSNHRSRGKRPASPRCRLSFAPYFGWRGESCANLHAGGAGPDGESQIDLGRLLVRVAAPPRAAEGLGRLPVRVAVAGAAVGGAATSAYTAYPPPYYRPPCGYYPYPACQ